MHDDLYLRGEAFSNIMVFLRSRILNFEVKLLGVKGKKKTGKEAT